MPDANIRRVLMTTDTVGGVWTFTLELAEALAASGIEVVLAAMGGTPSADQAAEASAIPRLFLLGSDFNLEWMEDPWADVEASGKWLLKLEHDYCPDIVHLNSFGHGALPWRAPTVLTVHSTVMSWFADVKGKPAPDCWNRYRDLVAGSLRAVDFVTAPSRALAAHITNVDCRVIPNGRNPAKFYRAAKEPFIFTAGRLWDEAKNVKAVAQIAAELPWPVYLAGESKDARLEGCHMLGRLPANRISDWYARAAIYAMPARYEPFGLSILEAALSGCALVLGDIPSLHEIWEQDALFASPDDTGALRKTIEALIADEGLRETLSHRAYRRALTFTHRHTADLYRTAYTDAVAARSRQCVS
jgi:glycogen(starch) synthase